MITKVGDRPVDDADSLIAAIRSHRPGDKVQVTYERSGQESTVTATLGSDGRDLTGRPNRRVANPAPGEPSVRTGEHSPSTHEVEGLPAARGCRRATTAGGAGPHRDPPGSTVVARPVHGEASGRTPEPARIPRRPTAMTMLLDATRHPRCAPSRPRQHPRRAAEAHPRRAGPHPRRDARRPAPRRTARPPGCCSWQMDLLYGRRRTLEKFLVLEIVARVPYQTWESASYKQITRKHRKVGLAAAHLRPAARVPRPAGQRAVAHAGPRRAGGAVRARRPASCGSGCCRS